MSNPKELFERWKNEQEGYSALDLFLAGYNAANGNDVKIVEDRITELQGMILSKIEKEHIINELEYMLSKIKPKS